MSSHHIVRDQQEPALIIDQLDQFPISILHALLEWLPTVICIENSIEKYTIYGHKLDIALVSFENFQFWSSELQNQQPVEILAVTPSQAITKSIELLRKRGHFAINVITEEKRLSGLVDEIIELVNRLELVIFTESKRYVIQQTPIFQKWMPSGSEVLIRPLDDNVVVTTLGFDSDLDGECINGEIVVNKSKEGTIEIKCSETPYLIVEDL